MNSRKVSALVTVTALLLASLPTEVFAADSRPPEISFSIHKMKDENVEGPDVERTYFRAGDKRIVFGQPKGSRLTVDGDGLLILLTEANLDGEIHVTRSPFTPGVELAANALKYRDSAAKGLPNGTTNLVVEQPVLNPYPFNGWKSLGFIWSYSYYGRSLVRTVNYINLEIGAQVVVTTVALGKDAEKVEKIAKQFMSSWWVMNSTPATR